MKKLFTVITTALSIAACSTAADDPYCFVSTGSGATAVTGPTTGLVNQPLVFNVVFKIYSSCGNFDSFYASSGFPKEITAKVDYEGCNCDNKETTKTEQYTFTANASGTYELRFKTDVATAPIVKTITITQ
jgi:hypothetical protein